MCCSEHPLVSQHFLRILMEPLHQGFKIIQNRSQTKEHGTNKDAISKPVDAGCPIYPTDYIL